MIDSFFPGCRRTQKVLLNEGERVQEGNLFRCLPQIDRGDGTDLRYPGHIYCLSRLVAVSEVMLRADPW